MKPEDAPYSLPWPLPEPSAEADAALAEALHDTDWREPDGVLAADIIRRLAARGFALSRPATPPLDVERLAEALQVTEEAVLATGVRMGLDVSAADFADAIAIEYAALANPTPEPSAEEE